MKFVERLASMGYEKYNDYLASDPWKAFKQKYKKSPETPKECQVCGYKQIQLHHITYERLGYEELTDVVPLCQKHHYAVHIWLKENRKSVRQTHMAVAVLKGLPQPPPLPSKRKRKKNQKKANRCQELMEKITEVAKGVEDDLITGYSFEPLKLSKLVKAVKLGALDTLYIEVRALSRYDEPREQFKIQQCYHLLKKIKEMKEAKGVTADPLTDDLKPLAAAGDKNAILDRLVLILVKYGHFVYPEKEVKERQFKKKGRGNPAIGLAYKAMHQKRRRGG